MNAAGVVIFSPGGRVLLLRRSPDDNVRPGEYDLPGGGAEPGETYEQCARRECIEETGWSPRTIVSVSRVPCTDGPGDYVAHAASCSSEFSPRLSSEHDGHVWVRPGDAVDRLHPGVSELLRRVRVE